MKNNLYSPAMAVAMAATMLVSCSKEIYEEGASSPTSDPNAPRGTLTVRTRTADGTSAADGEQPQVSYPVSIYVFDVNGSCCALSTISDESGSPVSIELAEGRYEVCAIAGADASGYSLPTQAEATKNSVIMARGPHSDLMAATNAVTLVSGGENTLTLALERKVMMIERVEIANVPGNVSAVSVTMAPLYSGLSVGGAYSGAGSSSDIALARVSGTSTWRSTEATYLLEASSDNATITVNMTYDDGGVASYSYTSAGELKANYRISISGTYTSTAGIELKGALEGATWAGQRDITFSFSDDGSNEEQGTSPDAGDTSQPTGVPEVGTLYMDNYFVVRTQATDNGTQVLLMAMLEADGLAVHGVDDGTVAALTQAVIDEIMSSDTAVRGWRLPTRAEIEYIDDNLASIQPQLNSLGMMLTSTPSDYYFYLTDEGTVSSFSFGSRKPYTMLGDWTRLRPVASIIIADN